MATGGDGDFFAGEEVVFEFVENQVNQVVQTRNCLELDLPKDWALQRLRK